MLAAGGVSIDGQRDLCQYSQGGFLASGTTPFRLYLVTRPLYEQVVRRRVSGLEGLALHHALAAGDQEDLAGRFFRRAAAIVDVAWTMAIGADFGFPQTQGRKPRGTAVFNWYLKRLFRTAQTDGAVTDAFVRVLMMEEPPSTLLRPGVAWRVLAPSGSVGKPLRERIVGRNDVDE